MNPAILITQCLQNDFVKPIDKFDPIPNQLHIGYKESLRLMGEHIHEGPVNTVMEWAYQLPKEELEIIHIRDWHDDNDMMQAEHLAQFGKHCIKGTEGAEFVFKQYINNENRHTIINASGLNDFLQTNLQNILDKHQNNELRVGIMGVWTEAKVMFLCYELTTRYPAFEIAVCSALTASSTRSSHFIALEQLRNILGVKVFSSVGSFTEYLAGKKPEISKRIEKPIEEEKFKIDSPYEIKAIDKKLIQYLFRQCREVQLKCLDGGFSGNVVLKAKSIDMYGHAMVPTVIKIGNADLIAKERVSFEKIQEVMGNSAPHIIDFVEMEDRGAIKYRYAAMLDGNVRTFQEAYIKSKEAQSTFGFLDTVFEKQLGKLYDAKCIESYDLLAYYDFNSKYAESVRKNVENILFQIKDYPFIHIIDGSLADDFYNFYALEIPQMLGTNVASHFKSFIHGDLNGRNILIDAQNNVWIIDFFHTHYGHVLRDLIKLENDARYIFTEINSQEEYEEAVKLIDIVFGIHDLSLFPDINENVFFRQKSIQKLLALTRKLHSYYPNLIDSDRDVYQYHVAALRYSMHNLTFDESSKLQKALALYASKKSLDIIRKTHEQIKQLRIDFIELNNPINGKIGLTMLPGRKDRNRNMDEDLQHIVNENINAVVCLLTEDEFIHYGVKELKTKYPQYGLKVKYLPILDQGVPTKEEIIDVVNWIDINLNEGRNVLIHCVGGLGRSGVVAAAYLVLKQNKSAMEAIQIVRKQRTARAIENKRQEGFVYSIID